MADPSSGVTRRIRTLVRLAYGVLVVHALYAVLTADWPEATALAFLLALWYDVRASTTLRRVRRQLFAHPDSTV